MTWLMIIQYGCEGGGQVREIFYEDGLPMHCIVLMNMRMNYWTKQESFLFTFLPVDEQHYGDAVRILAEYVSTSIPRNKS